MPERRCITSEKNGQLTLLTILHNVGKIAISRSWYKFSLFRSNVSTLASLIREILTSGVDTSENSGRQNVYIPVSIDVNKCNIWIVVQIFFRASASLGDMVGKPSGSLCKYIVIPTRTTKPTKRPHSVRFEDEMAHVRKLQSSKGLGCSWGKVASWKIEWRTWLQPRRYKVR